MPKVTLKGRFLAESRLLKGITTSLRSTSQIRIRTPHAHGKVDGQMIGDAAWYYPSTTDKAKSIEGYLAFYKHKVSVEA